MGRFRRRDRRVLQEEEQKKAQSDDMCLIMIQTNARIKAYEIQTEDFIRFYCDLINLFARIKLGIMRHYI